MSIPNRQIGWSNESNLLWQIAKQIERLTGITSKITPGGGGGAEVVTKAQVDTLISSNSLVPGTTYIISGVDVPLYGGTTVILQAETTNKLALAGHGLFYNPKYQNSQLTPFNGYGIWESTETYAIGQDVIWGGKHWTNTSGNTGTADDKYTLSAADWTTVPFNDVDYNVEIDVIHYDYIHDMIIRRKDRYDNDVDGSWQSFFEWADPNGYNYGNPIKDFQWGNYPDDFNTSSYLYLGVIANYVKDSYFDCLNFIGLFAWSNRLQVSSIFNTTTDKTGYLSYNTLTNANFTDNTITNDCGIVSNTLNRSQGIYSNTLNGGSIQFNILTDGSSIYNNTINNSGNITSNQLNEYDSIWGNTLTNSNIINNVLNRQSSINSNTLVSNSYITFNILNNSSFISSNSLTSANSYIEANILSLSSSLNSNQIASGRISKNILNRSNLGISNNILASTSIITQNTLDEDSSYIYNNNLAISSYIEYNRLNDSGIEGNTVDVGGRISRNVCRDSSDIYNNTNCRITENEMSGYSDISNNSSANISGNIIRSAFVKNINPGVGGSATFDYNTLDQSSFDFTSTGTGINGKTISGLTSTFAYVTANLSAATIIYASYPRQIFINSASATRLGYYNASDVFTVVNVTA